MKLANRDTIQGWEQDACTIRLNIYHAKATFNRYGRLLGTLVCKYILG